MTELLEEITRTIAEIAEHEKRGPKHKRLLELKKTWLCECMEEYLKSRNWVH